ncbi:Anaphase-promoting complex subunit 23 [Lobulomyces angularis]|nr:Anaphase-promoting complex subunit 23 [Lobulomyces angularis]
MEDVKIVADEDLVTMLQQFRHSRDVLFDICLFDSATWLSEHLVAFSEVGETVSKQEIGYCTYNNDFEPNGNQTDIFNLAKIYFINNEFQRAEHLLKGNLDNKSTFLKLFSNYMAGEKKYQDEETLENSSLKISKNENLPYLEEELSKIYDLKKDDMDPFLFYLYAIVSKELLNVELSIKLMFKSLLKFPLNWSGWLELGSLTFKNHPEDSFKLNFRNLENFILDFKNTNINSSDENAFEYILNCFKIYFQNKNQLFLFNNFNFEDTLSFYLNKYPLNLFFKNQKALWSSNEKDYADAEAEFLQIYKHDPYNLDNVDIYSNTLFILEKKLELSILANKCMSIEKYRHETCIVVANYYILNEENVKAIVYLQRALKLNKFCTSAWTIMGHEYINMKNSSAAVESYRSALDIDPTDYRAWHGLGNCYNLLGMNSYSIYYHQKACYYRPRDTRLWKCLAETYEKNDMHEAAIICLKKNLSLSFEISEDTNLKDFLYKKKNFKTLELIFPLAKILDKVSNFKEAKFYFDICLKDVKLLENDFEFKKVCFNFFKKHYARIKDFQKSEKYNIQDNYDTVEESD